MWDHRSVVVDIPYQYLLVEQVLKVVRPQARRIQCGLTGLKCQYLKKFETLFNEHNVCSKVSGVYIWAGDPPPPSFT